MTREIDEDKVELGEPLSVLCLLLNVSVTLVSIVVHVFLL